MDDDENYLDIREMARLFWRGRYVIAGTAFASAVIVALISLSQPNLYTAQVLVRPTEESAAGIQNAGVLSSIGALAGVRLGNAQSRTELALAVLESRRFLTGFARRHEIVPDLIAARHWDSEEQELHFDENIYSGQLRKWTRQPKPPLKAEPNDNEIFDAFQEILQVKRSPETGFIQVSVTFLSPVHASVWVTQLLSDLNDEIRRHSIFELDRSITYLREKLDETSVADLKASLAQLLQHEIRDRMLADAKAEYALETIDPASVPDFKSGPPRALMVLAAGVLGGILGVLIVLLNFGIRSPTASKPSNQLGGRASDDAGSPQKPGAIAPN